VKIDDELIPPAAAVAPPSLRSNDAMREVTRFGAALEVVSPFADSRGIDTCAAGMRSIDGCGCEDERGSGGGNEKVAPCNGDCEYEAILGLGGCGDIDGGEGEGDTYAW
jgi:hypothetical protein